LIKLLNEKLNRIIEKKYVKKETWNKKENMNITLLKGKEEEKRIYDLNNKTKKRH